ncbi:hypothetical protein IU427_24375 [Nocardia beijingensis]|uniref:hypothetical protein n=1 Tax=Nocardia beijingensis TaxID=95162 RepID=UPI0018959325|nr:hypothetical protein [Nocardia beijingensis]MBF6468282.1 hypothetical protein [Nocardia beijingensis]
MLAGIERLEDSHGSDHRMLRRTLRAAAAVSLSEVEWIHRMRATGATLQPRVSVVDGHVAGYLAQWRDAHSARLGPAITDLEVGAGLSLPDLRDGWEDDAQAAADAQTEWKLPRAIKSSARETALSAGPELWAHALADVRGFNEALARVRSIERGYGDGRQAVSPACWRSGRGGRSRTREGRSPSPRTNWVCRHLPPGAAHTRSPSDRPHRIWKRQRTFWPSYAEKFTTRPSNPIWSAN